MAQTRLKELLELTLEEEASDLHISVGHPPVLRTGRKLIPLVKKKKVDFKESKKMAFELMSESQKEKFLRERGIDFSYNFKGKARFRVN
ncbi:MAG: type IV pili twitching motility protein PilT, partial [Candidatus Paceibacterota bacterium]